ncbi:MAG: ribonuclease P protein component [Rhodocyclaceae bacterium]|nr:ribonuclease P protein component [Rhodocyclaceae bacterium]
MSSGVVTAENFGFDRQLRLRVATEFSEVFAARKVLRGPCFALHYRPNDRSHARLGLVIPKKQARAAVLRNAIKRQARELFRLRRAGLPPCDLVLRLARPVSSAAPVHAAIDPRSQPAWRAEIVGLFDQLCQKTTP